MYNIRSINMLYCGDLCGRGKKSVGSVPQSLSLGLRRARAESQVSATLSVFKNLGRRFPAKTFSRTIVNKIDNIIYSLLRNCTKIETFREEET